MGDTFKRNLAVRSWDQVGKFERDGALTKIFQLFMVDGDGQPVEPPDGIFKAFWEPNDTVKGQLIEYEIDPYDHPKFGRSYTVKRPDGVAPQPSGGGGGAFGSAADELKEEIAALKQRVTALERGQAATPQKAASSAADDDIPFARPKIRTHEIRERGLFSGDRWVA